MFSHNVCISCDWCGEHPPDDFMTEYPETDKAAFVIAVDHGWRVLDDKHYCESCIDSFIRRAEAEKEKRIEVEKGEKR